MKQSDLVNTLYQYFGDTFRYHPDFIKEFTELVTASGSEEKLMKQFVRRLMMISELGDRDYGAKCLEHLKGNPNMFSLHLDADSKNYRILFYRDNKGRFLLSMFYERSGKKATSYQIHINKAIERRETYIYSGGV